MKLLVSGIDKELATELKRKGCDITTVVNDDVKGAFFNLQRAGSDVYSIQKELREKCLAKKIPMIIFDGYGTLKDDEVSVLVSNGVFLWETAVNARPLFSYQPFWGKILTKEEIPLYEDERPIHLGCVGSLDRKFKTFEDYYVPIMSYGEHTVRYMDEVSNGRANKLIENLGIGIVPTNDYDLVQVSSTIMIGTQNHYKNGNLDFNLFRYLEKGIIPFIPKEHRWYHSVFSDLVIDDPNDILYNLAFLDKLRFAYVLHVYDSIRTYAPEMDVLNVANRIVSFLS